MRAKLRLPVHSSSLPSSWIRRSPTAASFYKNSLSRFSKADCIKRPLRLYLITDNAGLPSSSFSWFFAAQPAKNRRSKRLSLIPESWKNCPHCCVMKQKWPCSKIPKTGWYKNGEGELYGVNPSCIHLGFGVKWNNAENRGIAHARRPVS